jgi:thiol-disulfide isomerase/thioredoxin
MASAKYINFNQDLQSGDGILSRITGGSNLNTTTILMIAGVILFIALSLFYYFYYMNTQTKAKYHPNSEHNTSDSPNGNTAELLFFYADWCPHCKTAKPILDDLKSEYENKTINGYKIIVTDINCSEETAEVEQIMNKYSVEGYPTIKLLKDGQIIEYDAKPSKETLTQFLNTVL